MYLQGASVWQLRAVDTNLHRFTGDLQGPFISIEGVQVSFLRLASSWALMLASF